MVRDIQRFHHADHIKNWRYGNSESSFPIIQEDLVAGPAISGGYKRQTQFFPDDSPRFFCVCNLARGMRSITYKDTFVCEQQGRFMRNRCVIIIPGLIIGPTNRLERVSVMRDGTSSAAWVVAF